MRIAIVVHGRFHAFDLARALRRRGHDVLVVTNLPQRRAAAWDLPRAAIRSLPVEGAINAVAARAGASVYAALDAPLHLWFGRWAARRLLPGPWDLVVAFSGVAAETLLLARRHGWPTLCTRSSAHIRVQDRILAEEEARTGRRIQRPTRWKIEREEREYGLATAVQVPSTFVRGTFQEMGVPLERTLLVPLGVEVADFRASAQVLAARLARIEEGQPLRVLCAGSLSLRKGMYDLAAAVQRLPDGVFQFHLVGDVTRAARSWVDAMRDRIRITSRVPQEELPGIYEEADVLVLPTLEDGFAVVLAQALAAGVPIVTTPHSAGPDLVEEGRTGWIVPVRDPEALAARLLALHHDRPLLAAAVRALAERPGLRDWDDMAADYERFARAMKESG
ncbi:MAG: glycosyltransferase family 4 protein [Gemmatimonadota bacterium]